jgi:hypothetical protein
MFFLDLTAVLQSFLETEIACFKYILTALAVSVVILSYLRAFCLFLYYNAVLVFYCFLTVFY